MNLSYLRYFFQLAQTRHYTKTAQLLCITQPSLSHAIAQLEDELGVPLFEKSGRRLKNKGKNRNGETGQAADALRLSIPILTPFQKYVNRLTCYSFKIIKFNL